MTIEAQLDAVIAELKRLNAHFAHIGVATGHNDDAERTAAAQRAPAARKEPEKKVPEKKAPAKGAAKTTISYDDIASVVREKCKAGKRDQVVAVLAGKPFGVDHAQKLKPDQYADAHEALSAI